MTDASPKTYLSYSHDSAAHKKWVRELAEQLRADGVDVILDEWDLKPGDHIRESQERWVRESDAVIVVLTRGYVDRIGRPDTGVGFEFLLIASAASGLKTPRIIPIIRSRQSVPLPSDLAGLYLLDFSTKSAMEKSYPLLVDALLGRQTAPELGKPAAKAKPLPRNSNAPVTVERLRISNFRGIGNLDLRFCEPKKNQGQWIVLLGDNGVGKSSLLWAIGLALSGEELGHGILAGLASPLVRAGTEQAAVVAEADGFPFDCRVAQSRGREKLSTDTETSTIPVFGYGSSRGSALGGASRAVDLDRPLDSVGTLFGLRSSLIHAETWLRELEHGSLKRKTKRDTEFFNTVRTTLLDLLPGIEELDVQSDDVIVRGPMVGECSLSSLSDGYLTTIGWVLDLLARWTHEARQAEITIKPGFNQRMTGLVLIDELDLHLHPRWQTHIITDLRRAFPRMSFIATTHNPLTLLGTEEGEIYVLRREDKQLVATQQDLPAGIRADQVLTGIWFGLTSTLDSDTRKLLDQHRRMLRKGTKRTDPKRRKLERDLRKRLGSFADTSEDRMALEIAAEHMDDDYHRLTPGQRKDIQQKIKDSMGQRK